tara:strand:- start:89 stop:538 length:450 start_codon:yes stop_codon:yes gene_type:complete
MATRSRIGYVLKDDSIVSVYHHWDGYPEWLGVILTEHYNTDEKVRELIDGGDMSSCYSDNEYDSEKQEFVKVDPRPSYYSERGEDCPPRHSQTLSELAEIDCGEEFVYLWFMNTWNCYAINRTHDDDWNVINTSLSVRIIPQDPEAVPV